MSASEQMERLGIELPQVATPIAAYVPASQIGDEVWTSGQLPLVNGELRITGKVVEQVNAEQAKGEARAACLNAIAAVASVAGGVDAISRVLRVVVYVASDPAFVDQAAVANGASELIGDIFGEAGAHVRSAVGVSTLPLDACVEVELYCQL